VEIIKKLKQDSGLNMDQFSVKTGVKRSTLYSIFTRENDPTIDTVAKIASAHGITLGEFFTDEYVPPGLTDKEALALKHFRKMNEHGQDSALSMLEGLTKVEKMTSAEIGNTTETGVEPGTDTIAD